MSSPAATQTTLTVEQVRNMSLSECMAESRTRYEKAAAIEARHPNGVTPEHAEDFAEVKRLLTEVDLIETRTSELEEAGNRRSRIADNVKRLGQPANRHQQPAGDDAGAKSVITMFGQQFTDDAMYKSARDAGLFNNPRSRTPINVQLKGSLLAAMARKALIYSASGSGGNLIVNDRLPGFVDILQRQLTILDLIPTTQTTSNMIEYVKEKTFTNNAAAVAEASVTTGATGLKPESVLDFELATSPVQTIAHWIPVTNAMLADAPQIRGIIDNRLIYGLNQELEDQVLSGNGTSPNLSGILDQTGLQTLGLAAGATYGGQANVVDAAYAAMVQIQVTGKAMPDAFVFNPIDWAAVRLMRESAVTGNVNPGAYLYGPPSVSGPMTLWGRPVVESLGMTENTVLAGAFQIGCMLFDREDAAIRVGTIDDQFVRNMQTILAELRAAFVVFRDTAFARVTGA
jgi:HK97 family phage major capsid protein